MEKQIDLNELFKLRRNFEVRMLKLDRMIAGENPSALKSGLGVSQKEIDQLMSMDMIDLDRINNIANNRAIYTVGDYTNVSRLVDSLKDDDAVLASLIAELA